MPTLKQIEPIRKQIGNEPLLIVDGGIRRGTDILKCIALGANAVQIGRPLLWGLNHSGQSGVELVLDIINKELNDRKDDNKSGTADYIRLAEEKLK